MTESTNWLAFAVATAAAALRCGTPVGLAAVGETISERAGIINLGLEGIMLVGAATAVAVQVETHNVLLALVAACGAAGVMAAAHATMTVLLGANQIVSGIALAILGTGLSGFFGRPYVGVQFEGISEWAVPGLRGLPIIGPVLFNQDPLVYAGMLLATGAWALLYRTRLGLNIRAAGEDPEAAFARGVPIRRTRFIAVVLGGAFAGLGGAHLSLAYAHLWAEKMTSGQGWIAVGLVVIARWRPLEALLAAYVFGALTVLHPRLQAEGILVSPYLLATLPYVGAIVALTATSIALAARGQAAPAALGRLTRGR